MGPDVSAVIPVYRPDRDALTALIKAISAQDVPVLVVDDASPCTSDRLLRDVAECGTPVIRYAKNAGIARSLNAGVSWANGLDATWLLTVDQDTTLPSTYLADLTSELARILDSGAQIGALGAGRIDDASGSIQYPTWMDSGATITHEILASGTLWSVGALTAFGGFREDFGMDAVDADACLKLRRRGLAVAIAPAAHLEHRIGAGRQVEILGRRVLASGHSLDRRTSMVRNRLRLFPGEFAVSPVHALRTVRRMAMNTTLAITVEGGGWPQVNAAARGLLPRAKQ